MTQANPVMATRPLSAIDPATGDYWKSNQSEYWLVAAQSHRDTFACSERQRAQNEAWALECEMRAAELAEQVPA